MFSRIAIVNRGEAAMRLIHSVRDVNAEGGAQIQTIALYTDAERSAMFVREADIAYPLGPAVGRVPTSTSRCWSVPFARPRPTRCGWAGASWPRTPSSSTCVTAWA